MRISLPSVTTNHGATTVASATAVGEDQALKTSGNLIWSPAQNKVTNANSLYGNADFVEQACSLTDGLYATGESVVKIPLAGAAADYGYSDQYIIRVWLEGEDINCWNETAGQDFDISLRFVRLSDSVTQTADSDASPSINTPAAAVNNGTTFGISVTDSSNTAKGTITFTKTESTWAISSVVDAGETLAATTNLLAGSDTKTYAFADGTTFANQSDLTAYINQHQNEYDYTGLVLKATS